MASIKKNLLYNILLNVSNVLFPIITAPYVARVLGPEPCGLAGFASTYAGYFSMVAGMGIGQYSIREAAKRRDSKEATETLLSQLTSIHIINSAVMITAYMVSIILLDKMQSNFLIFFIAGISIAWGPLFVNSCYFTGRERFGYTTSRTLIIRLFTIACLFIFVKGPDDLYIYMICNLFAGAGVLFSNYYFMFKDGIRYGLTLKGLKPHYKPMLLLFSSSVAISVYTMLDSTMLGIFSSYSEVAYYGNAATLSKALLGVVTSLSIVAVPRMAVYFQNRDYDSINMLMHKSLCIVSFFAIPVAVGIACVAPVFVPLFLSDAYIPAIVPTMIMSGVVIAIGFNNLWGIQILIGLGYDKGFLYCVLVGTVTNFLLNLWMIPWLGATGAATSSVIAETLILLVEIWYVHKYTKVRFGTAKKDVLMSAVASLFFIPIAWFLYHIVSGWTYVITLVCSCSLTYFMLQNRMKSEGYTLLMDTIKNVVRRK